MKRFWILGSMLLCLSLSSCQCSNPPDVGPVEDESQAVVMPAPNAPVYLAG
ncbi:MAG TPA: hypothetical protein VKP65_07490 [Rhodothermales bacterium]|nr:hypothetical protein [Rhodothermales bacterium]